MLVKLFEQIAFDCTKSKHHILQQQKVNRWVSNNSPNKEDVW